MNWQETVLTDINGKDTEKAVDDLKAHNLPRLFSYRQAYFVGCETQAEPSYRVGFWEGRGTGITDGMREVVAWVEARIASGYFYCPHSRLDEWQTQLTEWGL